MVLLSNLLLNVKGAYYKKLRVDRGRFDSTSSFVHHCHSVLTYSCAVGPDANPTALHRWWLQLSWRKLGQCENACAHSIDSLPLVCWVAKRQGHNLSAQLWVEISWQTSKPTSSQSTYPTLVYGGGHPAQAAPLSRASKNNIRRPTWIWWSDAACGWWRRILLFHRRQYLHIIYSSLGHITLFLHVLPSLSIKM